MLDSASSGLSRCPLPSRSPAASGCPVPGRPSSSPGATGGLPASVFDRPGALAGKPPVAPRNDLSPVPPARRGSDTHAETRSRREEGGSRTKSGQKGSRAGDGGAGPSQADARNVPGPDDESISTHLQMCSIDFISPSWLHFSLLSLLCDSAALRESLVRECRAPRPAAGRVALSGTAEADRSSDRLPISSSCRARWGGSAGPGGWRIEPCRRTSVPIALRAGSSRPG